MNAQRHSIIFDNVTKRYRTGTKIIPSFGEWFHLIINKKDPQQNTSFKAVDSMSFKIKRGEVVGFIGPNGAGKSTILKLISKVSRPNSGKITTFGKIAGLLELGAGFHPELTGRENIVFNGMLLGLTKTEVYSKFNQIVAFSELKKFLDTPIKYYSTGMNARLGFSVSIMINPDILLVDEVLAVGDESFKKKCISKMKDFCKNKDKTVIFVSHDLAIMNLLCDRVIYIKNGKVIIEGDPKKIIHKYQNKQE